jgi:hypothetical protein
MKLASLWTGQGWSLKEQRVESKHSNFMQEPCLYVIK